ncbi:MAG: hypothetical protein KDD82_04115 [Planctomycetes bacterium]|nr:hypothetical protein [Planctomycetota bacterium]
MRPLTLLALHALVGLTPLCADGPAPRPARAPEALRHAGVDLEAALRAGLRQVLDPEGFNAATADAQLRLAYEQLFTLDAARIDLARLDARAAQVVQLTFELQLAIDERMAEFDAAGRYPAKLANAKRRALRGLRYLRERVLLRTARADPGRLYGDSTPRLAAWAPAFHWTVRASHAQLPPERFPRTFVLLSEGGSPTSAAIARSADEDNMFSHLSVGYVSDQPYTVKGVDYPAGTPFTIESFINSGVTVRLLEAHMSGKNNREVLFFLRDPAKQAALDQAAEAFFERVLLAQASGAPLGYDFSMGTAKIKGLVAELEGTPGNEGRVFDPAVVRMDGAHYRDVNDYFCSEVGEAVFATAGLQLFPHRSTVEAGAGTRRLFESWGIDPSIPISAPGDADVSPALVRIAEGAKLGLLRANHQRHAALTSVFRWLDDGYTLRVPWYVKAFGKTAAGYARLPILPSFGLPKVSADVMISTIALNKVASKLTARLAADDEAFFAEHGRAMTPAETYAHLDRIRGELKLARWLRPVE